MGCEERRLSGWSDWPGCFAYLRWRSSLCSRPLLGQLLTSKCARSRNRLLPVHWMRLPLGLRQNSRQARQTLTQTSRGRSRIAPRSSTWQIRALILPGLASLQPRPRKSSGTSLWRVSQAPRWGLWASSATSSKVRLWSPVRFLALPEHCLSRRLCPFSPGHERREPAHGALRVSA